MKTAPVKDLQGHRGCRGLMPENTIPAMIHALELGVNTLEMDVSITADNQVILSHEPFFNHEITTKPNGEPVTESEERSLNMYKMTYDSVCRYDVGLKPHPRFPEQKKMVVTKPLLTDVFQAVQNWCNIHQKPLPIFNIETKTLPIGDQVYHPLPEPFVDLLMSVISKAGMEKQVTIQSFDFRTLKYMHDKFPDIPLAALVEENDTTSFSGQLQLLGFVPQIYSPASMLVTEQLMMDCKTNNMKCIPWTVNDTTEADRLKKLGVDGIITDFPDRIH